MSETWLQEYIFLAFRLHRAVETTYGSPFVEDYWGPKALRKLVEAEPETVPADLVRQAMALADALPVQGFAPNRVAYLDKHVRAMETLARKLCGETFTLAEEAKRSLDIHPTWTPEAQFEQAHALYESTVSGGAGGLAERVRAYRLTFAFPQEPSDVLKEVIEQAFAEARKRTRALMALPEEETIEMQYFPEKQYDAAARYHGSYRTRMEMNLAATAAWFPRLFDHKVCHEGYPGHHRLCAQGPASCSAWLHRADHVPHAGYRGQTELLSSIVS